MMSSSDNTATPPTIPHQFTGVTAQVRASVYFGGKVVAHTIFLGDGTKKTLGLIFPGRYHFLTEDLATRVEVVSGTCYVKLDGTHNWTTYSTKGDFIFEVTSRAGFEIEVRSGTCEYICTFIKA